MKDKVFGALRHFATYLIGPGIVIGIVFFIYISTGATAPFRHPLAPFTIAVLIASFIGGVGPGLLTSAVATVYLAYYYFSSIPGSLHFTGEDYSRLLSWTIAYPIISLTVGLLKKRSEKALRAAVEASQEREEDMRMSEARIRAVINFSNDPFIAINSLSKIIEWNPQAEKTFGWSRAEALGQELSQLIIPEEFRSAHHQGLDKLNQTGEGKIINRRVEVTAINKEGSKIPIELTVYPIRQKNETIYGAFIRDISERKILDQMNLLQFSATRVMSEARSLEDGIPQLLKTLGQGLGWPIVEIWLTDENKKFFSLLGIWTDNPEMEAKLKEASLGLQIQKSEGLLGTVATETHPLWITYLEEREFPRDIVIREMGIETIVYCPINVENDLVGALCLHNTSLLNADVKILDLMNDVSKRLGMFILRKWAEDDLKQLSKNLELKVQERTEELNQVNHRLQEEVTEKQILYEQAQTANRLKDEFLATISHELRTPMNVILGHSELLHGDDLTEEEKHNSIEAIYRNTKAQSHIVSDILDISKFITGKVQLNMEVVNMAEIISQSIESVLPTAQAKSIEITESISSDTGLVSGDVTRLQQVLWNLLSNAIKFTPRRGQIFVSLSKAESNVVLTVKDSGKGIDGAFLPYVFDRFRQEDASTTRKFGGLGLGLAITRSIVEAHGGNIQATSEGKNLGATFTVILPITSLKGHREKPKKTNEKSSEPPAEESHHGKRLKEPLKDLTILAVDDQPDALSIIETVLSRVGAKVLTANTASDAFKCLIRNKPDLIISDIGMPEKDGYELIRMIRRLPEDMGGNIPALALTAFAHEEEHQKALDLGFNAHLSKPAESKVLIHMAAMLCGKEEFEKEQTL